MTKTDLTFQALPSRFVDFAAQFCLCHDSISWTNHNSLLRIATNEIASFCVGQMAFIVFHFVYVKWHLSLPKWANDGFRVYMLKDLDIKKGFLGRSLFLYNIERIDSMLQ